MDVSASRFKRFLDCTLRAAGLKAGVTETQPLLG